MFTIAGTIEKDIKVTPNPNTPLYKNPNLEAPKPIDFARCLARVKPVDDQKWFVVPYYLNSQINSVSDPIQEQNDPYGVIFITRGFETREEAVNYIKELAEITGMNNWGLVKAYQPFVLKINPDKDNCDNLLIVKGEENYQKIEQQCYDKRVKEYEEMIQRENERQQYGQKLVNPDSYEFFQVYMKTLEQSEKEYLAEELKLKEFRSNIDNRKKQVDQCLEKHPEFLQMYNKK